MNRGLNGLNDHDYLQSWHFSAFLLRYSQFHWMAITNVMVTIPCDHGIPWPGCKQGWSSEPPLSNTPGWDGRRGPNKTWGDHCCGSSCFGHGFSLVCCEILVVHCGLLGLLWLFFFPLLWCCSWCDRESCCGSVVTTDLNVDSAERLWVYLVPSGKAQIRAAGCKARQIIKGPQDGHGTNNFWMLAVDRN